MFIEQLLSCADQAGLNHQKANPFGNEVWCCGYGFAGIVDNHKPTVPMLLGHNPEDAHRSAAAAGDFHGQRDQSGA